MFGKSAHMKNIKNTFLKGNRQGTVVFPVIIMLIYPASGKPFLLFSVFTFVYNCLGIRILKQLRSPIKELGPVSVLIPAQQHSIYISLPAFFRKRNPDAVLVLLIK